MLKDLICGKQVYVVTGYTDLRKSIDGLAAIVQGQLEVDVFSKGVFLFCGRRCDRIKGLLWECSCFAAGDVTESKDCFGKVMDFCCCTKGLITGNFNGPAMKRKQDC